MNSSASALLRAARSRLQRPSIELGIASCWFVVVVVAVVWVWGIDPQVTLMPDELVNRQAAELVRAQGSPRMVLPFVDPEDLAHPRFWISIGQHAVPAYAPLSIYWFSLWLRLGWLGLLAIVAMPAAAVAAFVVGVARLLPSERRWLAALAPLLAAPALYWLLRPWMNVAPLLCCLCCALFCWATWLERGNPRFISYAALCVGGAAAVRPDYAAYLFVAALLVGMTAAPAHKKRVIASILAAGSAAVAVNLVLNKLSTGDPLLAAYQIQLARQEGGDTGAGAGLGRRLLGLLIQLLAPMGVPTPKTAQHFLSNYWLHLGSVAGLTVTQLTLLPLLARQPRAKQLLYGAALLVMFCLMLSRMDPTLFGASTKVSSLDHSIPRYWSPVYLIAALPPILFLAQAKTRELLRAGGAALCWLALAGGYDICVGTRWSLFNLRGYRQEKTELLNSLVGKIPKQAFVYTETHDKVLWRRWRVGMIDQPEPTAASMARALQAGLEVYAFEPLLKPSELQKLEQALRGHGLSLERQRTRGLSQVVLEPRPQ
jgi:hypothetical protein